MEYINCVASLVTIVGGIYGFLKLYQTNQKTYSKVSDMESTISIMNNTISNHIENKGDEVNNNLFKNARGPVIQIIKGANQK